MSQHVHQRPQFNNFGGRIPWRSPRPPMRQSRPPHLSPPFGMTPEGFRLPGHLQAPPMFGPRGATLPPHLMNPCNPRGKPSRFNQDDSSKPFWCETCDRGFNSKDLLDKHNGEHQKCGIDGCKFTAHANIVTKHIQMQHKTGLYDKIRNINTPEDIQNWINERKKKYPTRNNIEKQKAQRKECFERGEKLQDDKSRFNNHNRGNRGYNSGNNNRCNNRGRNNMGNKRRDNPFQDAKNIMKNSSNPLPNPNIDSNILLPHVNKKNYGNLPINSKKDKKEHQMLHPNLEISSKSEMCCNLKPFKGTSDLVRIDLICEDDISPVTDDMDIEDEEWQHTETVKSTEDDKLVVCNALSNLIGAYDSSDSESDEGKIKTLSSETKIETSAMTATKPILETNSFLGTEVLPPGNSEIHNNLKIVKVCNESVLVPEVVSSQKNHDAESDGSEPEEVKIEKVQELSYPNGMDVNISTNKRTRKRKHSTDVNKDPLPKIQNKNSNVNKKNIKGPNIPQRNFRRAPKTLLEKLLEKHIRNERNLILQCTHFIVKNNFFNQIT